MLFAKVRLSADSVEQLRIFKSVYKHSKKREEIKTCFILVHSIWVMSSSLLNTFKGFH